MVPRPRFMSINAPLHIPRSRSLEEERNKILGVFTTRFIAASITRHASGGVEIRYHFQRAVWSCVILSGEVKHLRCFRIQHAHNLWRKEVDSTQHRSHGHGNEDEI